MESDDQTRDGQRASQREDGLIFAGDTKGYLFYPTQKTTLLTGIASRYYHSVLVCVST